MRRRREPWDGGEYTRPVRETTYSKDGKVVDVKMGRAVYQCSEMPKKITKGLRRQLARVQAQNPQEADRQRQILGSL